MAAGTARANVFVVLPDDLGDDRRALARLDRGRRLPRIRQPPRGNRAPRRVRPAPSACRWTRRARGALLRVARETSAYYEAELEPERDEAYGRSRSSTCASCAAGSRCAPARRSRSPTAARGRDAEALRSATCCSRETRTPTCRLRVGGFTVRRTGRPACAWVSWWSRPIPATSLALGRSGARRRRRPSRGPLVRRRRADASAARRHGRPAGSVPAAGGGHRLGRPVRRGRGRGARSASRGSARSRSGR